MDTALAQRVSAFHAVTAQVHQRLDYETGNISRLNAKIAQIEKDKTQLVMAVGLIDKTIQVISANGISKIESVVSGGLQMVFGDKDLALVIDKKDGARGSSYQIFIRQGDFMGKPMDSFGGGVVNVAAFLLRVIMIKRFKLAKFLAVDESFNNVSNDGGHLTKVSEMLQKLCHDHGYTILAVTHQPVLADAADNAYRLVPQDGPPVIVRIDPSLLGDASATAEPTNPSEVN